MKRFLLPLLAALALPTAVSAEASLMTQKAYGASILGANLCFLRQGKLTKQSFVLNVENLMLKRDMISIFYIKIMLEKQGN